MARFTPHGELSAVICGKVLYFESVGPFNAEVVDAVVRTYRPVLAQLADAGPFAHITVFHRSMLATPDAMQAFAGLLAEWKRSGLAPIANAYVAGVEVEGSAIMLPMFARAFEGFGPFRGFQQLDAAEDWVGAALREAGVDDAPSQ
jgi:hypothetical protein